MWIWVGSGSGLMIEQKWRLGRGPAAEPGPCSGGRYLALSEPRRKTLTSAQEIISLVSSMVGECYLPADGGCMSVFQLHSDTLQKNIVTLIIHEKENRCSILNNNKKAIEMFPSSEHR